MTPKKQLIFEVFELLNTHQNDSWRSKFDIKYVTSFQESISINIRREVLEDGIQKGKSSTANDILTSVNEAFGCSNDAAGINPKEDG